jgi:hypothetical protein
MGPLFPEVGEVYGKDVHHRTQPMNLSAGKRRGLLVGIATAVVVGRVWVGQL